jgi:hypothetical protein
MTVVTLEILVTLETKGPSASNICSKQMDGGSRIYGEVLTGQAKNLNPTYFSVVYNPSPEISAPDSDILSL